MKTKVINLHPNKIKLNWSLSILLLLVFLICSPSVNAQIDPGLSKQIAGLSLNAAKTKLNVKLLKEGSYTYAIEDSKRTEIKQGTLTLRETDLDIGNLKRGSYKLRVKNNATRAESAEPFEK